ncbi:hypothetical protein BD770DRAFT_395530 [Pilaira anomala]|nr:hypothetical protein BD770DRAFT_395530 [Pilaira anomala]
MAPVKRKRLANNTPIKISVAPPPPPPPLQQPLPPPLVPYHPHLVPSYYPVYHQHPYFLQVGPQPPISPSLSPTLPSSPVNNNDPNKTTTATTTAATTTTNSQRILPKSPISTHPTLAPTFNYFPYPVQVSPQLHPTATTTSTTNNNHGSPSQVHLQPHPGSISPMPFQPTGFTPVRHNSTSSITTTADQREQARKVSHSAIERRRRERINDKIIQLKELIPTCANQENLHKMTILQSAIEYITYLKKLVEEKDVKSSEQEDNSSRKDVSMDDVSPGIIVNEDTWSVSSSPKPTHIAQVAPLPTMGLKPMDLINLNKRSNTPPPRIVIHEHMSDGSTSSIVDRNMNLENILC